MKHEFEGTDLLAVLFWIQKYVDSGDFSGVEMSTIKNMQETVRHEFMSSITKTMFSMFGK